MHVWQKMYMRWQTSTENVVTGAWKGLWGEILEGRWLGYKVEVCSGALNWFGTAIPTLHLKQAMMFDFLLNIPRIAA